MATLQPKYTTEQSVTITTASLASDSSLLAGREGAEVDNSSNLYMDMIVGGKITTGSASFSAGIGEIWVGGSIDGTDYPSGLVGTNANRTINNKLDLYRGVIISLGSASTTYIVNPFSVARLFGGVMPPYVTFFLVHDTVAALSSTEADCEIVYRGVNLESV